MTRRIENLRGNRQRFRVLKEELSIAVEKANLCGSMLEEYCKANMTDALRFELIDLRGMSQTIRRVEESVDELEKNLPPRRKRFGEFLRASRNEGEIAEEVQTVREMSLQLSDMGKKLKGFAQQNDIFRPDFSSVPKLRALVHLNFSSENTMEGKLKAEFLRSVNRQAPNTPNVYGHVTAVVGVSGMGGVGKTTAVIGLAHDPDVQNAFSSGGIYFVVVGKNASPAKLVAAMKEMIRRSGGEGLSGRIDNSGSLQSAVSATSSWFSGRRALFILDDLWQTPSNQLGYYEALMGLLDDSPDSHILISTRSAMIASETSAIVEFEPREKTGSDSRGMFLASAGLNGVPIHDHDSEELLQQVLELCGGIPLMLAIAGAQVRRHRGTTIASLKHLIQALDDKRLELTKEQRGHYPSCFNQAVKVSLETVADVLKTSAKFMESWNEQSRCNHNNPTNAEELSLGDFVIDCFRRLCVLPRSARVSKEVIFGIWGRTDTTMAWGIIDFLVDFHLLLEFQDEQGNSKFGVHDVILDYCRSESQYGKGGKYKQYHREFLIHVWKLFHPEPFTLSDTVMLDTPDDSVIAHDAFWFVEACESVRPWWKILSSPEELYGIQNYLLENIFRHLRECGRIAEAVGLLSHMGWTKLRISRGGIIALNSDFALVADAIRSYDYPREDREVCDDAVQGLTKIWNMVKRAWPVIMKNADALPTHAYGYLLNKENKPPLVGRYLQSTVDIATGAWFKPKSAFWQILYSSSNSLVFRCAERIRDIAAFKDTQMIIAATKSTLFWIDEETMNAARERAIRDEEVSQSEIRSFCISERKGIIVLGFTTGKLELRDEERGNLLFALPNAHENDVRSVDISEDGRRVVSGSSDHTVRLWDTQTGTQIGDPLRGHESDVWSVAFSEDGRRVVSGSGDTTVRLWDTQTGTQIGDPLRGHESDVWSVAFSEDGRRVVSGSGDTTVRLWDTQTGTQIGNPLHGHESIVLSVAFSEDGRRVVSGSGDTTVRLWDTHTGTQIGDPLRGHENTVLSVAFREDGRWIVSSSLDNTLRLWDAQTGVQTVDPLRGHENTVYSVAFNEGGQRVVSGSMDTTVRLWDAQTGAQIW